MPFVPVLTIHVQIFGCMWRVWEVAYSGMPQMLPHHHGGPGLQGITLPNPPCFFYSSVPVQTYLLLC